VWINCHPAMDPAVPFGGHKMNGYAANPASQRMEDCGLRASARASATRCCCRRQRCWILFGYVHQLYAQQQFQRLRASAAAAR